MVALLRDIITDAPRAIQRTALSGDGGKIGRRTLGPKAGAAIKLSADVEVADRLTIGEGLETTLAGMMLGYAPAWKAPSDLPGAQAQAAGHEPRRVAWRTPEAFNPRTFGPNP
jgi:hypothetical protein